MSCLTPDEGYLFYSFDLSQIENRIVAYVGRCTSMMEAFEAGIDLHRLTAALIFNKEIHEVSDEPRSCSLGSGEFSERFWGKKSNHSLNYDYGYKSFALLYEVPEREAKWITERYHHVYPEVRANYHSGIVAQLARDRTLTNLFGRRRKFLAEWGDKLFKVAYAFIPQSTTADKIDEHGLCFIWENYERFEGLQLLNVVHDSIGFQLPLSIPWKEHARMLMEIKESLEIPLIYNDREFIVPADLSYGLTLNKEECKELKHKKFPKTIEELERSIEDGYAEMVRKREGK
jgi:DNA polymerase I-like protein with 3'-5' exonuclease and polymerase domains